MVVTGFVPSPLGHITEYTPTFSEVMITIGIYAVGALILTVLYKIATEVRKERDIYQQPTTEQVSATGS